MSSQIAQLRQMQEQGRIDRSITLSEALSDVRLREETYEGLLEEGLHSEAYEYRRKWKL